MSGPLDQDPEQDLAEHWLDIGDIMQSQYEYWMQQADTEPVPLLRVMLEEIAADAMLIANTARAAADDLLREYDD